MRTMYARETEWCRSALPSTSADECPMIAWYDKMSGLPDDPLNVTEGEPLVVRCLCMDDTASATTLSWRKPNGGMDITAEQGDVAVLNFTAVRAGDSGMYNCSSERNGTAGDVVSFTLRVLGECGVLVHLCMQLCSV